MSGLLADVYSNFESPSLMKLTSVNKDVRNSTGPYLLIVLQIKVNRKSTPCLT